MTRKLAIRKKAKPKEEEEREIAYSVFAAPGYQGQFVEFDTLDHRHPMTKIEFDAVADSVRHAIRMGIHPRMIRQGSSGSYFVSNPAGKTVAIFKPKNEEPYGKLNPKWTKWLHRNLFPCFFGRSWLSCLRTALTQFNPQSQLYLRGGCICIGPTIKTLHRPIYRDSMAIQQGIQLRLVRSKSILS